MNSQARLIKPTMRSSDRISMWILIIGHWYFFRHLSFGFRQSDLQVFVHFRPVTNQMGDVVAQQAAQFAADFGSDVQLFPGIVVQNGQARHCSSCVGADRNYVPFSAAAICAQYSTGQEPERHSSGCLYRISALRQSSSEGKWPRIDKAANSKRVTRSDTLPPLENSISVLSANSNSSGCGS